MSATSITLNGSALFTASGVLATGVPLGTLPSTLVTPGEVVASVGNASMSWATGDDPGQVNAFWASRLTISSTFQIELNGVTVNVLKDLHSDGITWEAVAAIICYCVDGEDTVEGHAAYLQALAAIDKGWIDATLGARSPFGAAETPTCHMTKGSVIVLTRPGNGEYLPGTSSCWEIKKHAGASTDAVVDLLLVGRRVGAGL